MASALLPALLQLALLACSMLQVGQEYVVFRQPGRHHLAQLPAHLPPASACHVPPRPALDSPSILQAPLPCAQAGALEPTLLGKGANAAQGRHLLADSCASQGLDGTCSGKCCCCYAGGAGIVTYRPTDACTCERVLNTGQIWTTVVLRWVLPLVGAACPWWVLPMCPNSLPVLHSQLLMARHANQAAARCPGVDTA